MDTGNSISLENLLPLPQEIKDKFTDLEEIRRKRQTEAYESLVRKKTPRDVIKQRPIRGGKMADYVPAWWFVEQANALFGHLWSFEVVDQFIGDNQVWVQGKVTITIPGEDVVETFPDGSQRAYKRPSITIIKTQFGGHDIAKKDGKVLDIGDTLKSAATDSMKKCLTLIGIAADVYGDREMLELERKQEDNAEEIGQKLRIAYKEGEAMGWDEEQVNARIQLDLGKNISELEGEDGLEIIRIMRAAKKEMTDAS